MHLRVSKVKSGMEAIHAAIGKVGTPLPQDEICHHITAEIRAELNSLWANDNGPASGRMGKKMRDAKLAKIQGMRIVLTLALGSQLGYPHEIDTLLEEFKQERLARSKEVNRQQSNQ